MVRQVLVLSFVLFFVVQRSTTTDLPPVNGVLGDLFKLIPTLSPLPSLGLSCTGTSSLLPGTCKQDGNCGSVGGVADGQCLGGLGTCCAKVSTCDSTALLNNTFFSNPDYPNGVSQARQCPMTIVKLPGAVQIRIDFLEVNMQGPVDGRCQTDSITVEGINPGVAPPRLCGKLSGQHIYLPVDQTAHASQIIIRVGIAGSQNATWLMKVSQVTDLLGVVAPHGCLSYRFGELQGRITSFNSDNTTNVPLGNIAGLRYSVCFRKEAGYCGIRFQAGSSLTRVGREANYNYPAPNQVVNHPGSYHGAYVHPPQYAAPAPQQVPYAVPIAPVAAAPVVPVVPAAPILPLDVASTTVPPPKAVNCDGQDIVYFPPADILCDNTGFKDVTINITPLTVYVDNRGTLPSKGFAFDFNYLAC